MGNGRASIFGFLELHFSEAGVEVAPNDTDSLKNVRVTYNTISTHATENSAPVITTHEMPSVLVGDSLTVAFSIAILSRSVLAS